MKIGSTSFRRFLKTKVGKHEDFCGGNVSPWKLEDDRFRCIPLTFMGFTKKTTHIPCQFVERNISPKNMTPEAEATI